MDSEVHDGASSSQNVDRIERIVPGAGSKCTVHLRSGSSFFVPVSVVHSLALKEGAVLDSGSVDELHHAQQVYEGTEKAVTLLARREHSVAQLRLKLAKRGYEPETIAEICSVCLERGYVDDYRFAEHWIENRIRRHHEGIVRLRAGLARAGISREIASAAMSNVLPSNYEECAFERAVEEIEARQIDSPARRARRLTSLGFPLGAIRRYIEG